MPCGSAPRERMWNESRQVPRFGWSPACDDPPGVVVVAHVAAPGERLVGDADPVLGGALGQRVELGGGERVVVDRGRGDVRADQQQVGAELLHHRELALRAPQVRPQLLLAGRPRSRGTAGRARSRGRGRPPAGGPRRACAPSAMRSGSNSSTSSKPAAAAAASLSSSVPLRHTVAIERRITWRARPRRAPPRSRPTRPSPRAPCAARRRIRTGSRTGRRRRSPTSRRAARSRTR